MGWGFSLLLNPTVGESTSPFLLKATGPGFVFLLSDAINSDWVTFPPRSPKPTGLELVSHGSQAGLNLTKAWLLSCWAHVGLSSTGILSEGPTPPWAVLLNFSTSKHSDLNSSVWIRGWSPLDLGILNSRANRVEIKEKSLQLSWECHISEVTQRGYTHLFRAAPAFCFPLFIYFFLCVSVELREAVEIRKVDDQCFV